MVRMIMIFVTGSEPSFVLYARRIIDTSGQILTGQDSRVYHKSPVSLHRDVIGYRLAI